MDILVLYGSLEGQTQKIAERITEVLRRRGYQATTLSGEQLPADFSLASYDAVIVGASIHIDRYPKYIKHFVNNYRDQLNNMPSAFFTVCMAIHSQQARSQQQAIRYGEAFLEQTGWRPTLSTTFAGAIKYTQYNFFIRFIMKMIARREGGSTDTSRDHEYTDWQAVEQFAEAFLDKIAS